MYQYKELFSRVLLLIVHNFTVLYPVVYSDRGSAQGTINTSHTQFAVFKGVDKRDKLFCCGSFVIPFGRSLQ